MTDNTHDHFDEVLQDAARTYNRPPEEQDMPSPLPNPDGHYLHSFHVAAGTQP